MVNIIADEHDFQDIKNPAGNSVRHPYWILSKSHHVLFENPSQNLVKIISQILMESCYGLSDGLGALKFTQESFWKPVLETVRMLVQEKYVQVLYEPDFLPTYASLNKLVLNSIIILMVIHWNPILHPVGILPKFSVKNMSKKSEKSDQVFLGNLPFFGIRSLKISLFRSMIVFFSSDA